jgi:CRP-like cAMP-binding protein
VLEAVIHSWSADDLNALTARMHMVEYAAGEMIFQQDAPATYFVLLLQGELPLVEPSICSPAIGGAIQPVD